MLKHIISSAKYNRIDAVLSSFGSTPTLLNFWRKSGFSVLKYGHKADKSSGLTSVLAGLASADLDINYFTRLAMFDRYFGLPGKAKANEPPLHSSDTQACLNDTSLHASRLQQFISGTRSIEQLGGSGYWWIQQSLTAEPSADCAGLGLLQDVFSNRLDEQELMKRYGLKGKQALYGEIRRWLKKLYQKPEATD